MKHINLTVLLCLLSAGSAHALPVIDANTPSSEMVTIYPDSTDKNLYYLVPKNMLIAKDASGVPMFSYTEVSHFMSTDAVVQVSMTPTFDEVTLAKAEENILATNPNSKFGPVPFLKSEVVFSNELSDLIESSDCNHEAGVVGSDETCIFRLSSQGRKVMLNSLSKKATIYMNFQYTVSGVTQDGKGGYIPATPQWEITGAIGGEELSAYPFLFLNSDGKPIHF
jgi:hypothetical protein